MTLALRVFVASALLLPAAALAQPDCPRTLIFKTTRPSEWRPSVPRPTGSSLDPSLTPARFHALYGHLFAPAGRTLVGGGKGEYAVTGVGELGQPYCLGVGLGFIGAGDASESSTGFLYPICWHGAQVATTGECGADQTAFEATLSSWLAGQGGLKQLLARYEQIPVSGEGALGAKCVRPGETTTFELKELRAAVPKLRTSEARPRLVALAEDGTVENGEKGAVPNEKVFVLDSTSVFITYRAPDDRRRAADVLHVWNSCDVASPVMTPYAKTTKKDELGRFELPLCDNYRLEYQYDATFTDEGANLVYRVRGEVPFTIKDRRGQTHYDRAGRPKDTKLTIEGRATLTATLTGREGECTLSASKQFDVTLGGEARYARNDWWLALTIEEDHGKRPLSMTLTCPDEDEPITFSKPVPAVGLAYQRIELQDGEGKSVEGPFQGQGGRGTYRLVLHTSNGR